VASIYGLANPLKGTKLAIPQLQPNGLLPPGVYECTIDEIRERFGVFRGSDRRPDLFRDLASYVRELQSADIAKHIVINGSFVTATDSPNDIDVLLVLKDDFPHLGVLPPYQYNAKSRKFVRRHYRLDFFYGFEGDPSFTEIMALFSKVKDEPTLEKGILLVRL
jgi:hypothetical protein